MSIAEQVSELVQIHTGKIVQFRDIDVYADATGKETHEYIYQHNGRNIRICLSGCYKERQIVDRLAEEICKKIVA